MRKNRKELIIIKYSKYMNSRNSLNIIYANASKVLYTLTNNLYYIKYISDILL